MTSKTNECTDSGVSYREESSKNFIKNLVRASISQLSDRKIIAAISKIYGLKLGGAAMAYFVQVAVAFYLGATNYGVFALAWIIATTLGQVCCCGFNDTSNRFLPGYLTVLDFRRARGFVHFALKFTIIVSVAVALILASFMMIARDSIPEFYVVPILIALVCVPILTFTHLKESIAISRSQIIAGLFPTYLLRPALLIVFTVSGAILAQNNNAEIAVFALLAASVVVALLQTCLMAKPLNDELGVGDMIIERSRWLWASLPLLLAQGFFVLTTSIDVVVLSFFVPPGELGIYFAAAKIVTLLSFVHAAVASGMTRRMSEALSQDDRADFQMQFRRGRVLMIVPTFIGFGILSVGAPYLLMMFGPEFVAGYAIVPILATGLLAQATGGPVQEAMIVSGHQKAVSVILGIFFVMNLVLSILLVRSMGMTGVAIASAFTISARIGAMYIFARFVTRTAIA